MSTRKRNGKIYTYAKNRDAAARDVRGLYVYGSTAPEAEIRRQFEEPDRQPSIEVQKNREKARHMSAGYVLFLGAALLAAGYILVNYLQMQADLTNLTKTVAAKKSELINLKEANDEEYNRINNSIDLEEIRRVAMGTLGMTYADKDQIVIYESEKYDYMRQVNDGGY